MTRSSIDVGLHGRAYAWGSDRLLYTITPPEAVEAAGQRASHLPNHRVIGRRQGDVLTGGMQNSQVGEIRFDLAVAQSRR